MYGSSYIIVTRRPRASRIAASEAAAIPLPSEDTTPPVTKIRGVTGLAGFMAPAARWKATFYRMGRPRRTGWTGRPRFTMGSFSTGESDAPHVPAVQRRAAARHRRGRPAGPAAPAGAPARTGAGQRPALGDPGHQRLDQHAGPGVVDAPDLLGRVAGPAGRDPRRHAGGDQRAVLAVRGA